MVYGHAVEKAVVPLIIYIEIETYQIPGQICPLMQRSIT